MIQGLRWYVTWYIMTYGEFSYRRYIFLRLQFYVIIWRPSFVSRVNAISSTITTMRLCPSVCHDSWDEPRVIVIKVSSTNRDQVLRNSPQICIHCYCFKNRYIVTFFVLSDVWVLRKVDKPAGNFSGRKPEIRRELFHSLGLPTLLE